MNRRTTETKDSRAGNGNQETGLPKMWGAGVKNSWEASVFETKGGVLPFLGCDYKRGNPKNKKVRGKKG